MIKIKHRIRGALLIGAFFLQPLLSRAQNQFLELLPGAEKLSYNEKTGAQRITGNLSFKYQGNLMYCDSADYYDRTNEVRAYGHVHINKNDTLNLYCDSLHYNGHTRKAKLWGHVRVRDREYKLSTDSLEYDAKVGVAIYRHGGKIESIEKGEVLTSRVGYMYPGTKNMFFSGKVKYKSERITMETDTLRFQYLSKKVYFHGPTRIKAEEYNISCRKGWFQVETEEGVLQEQAEIIKESAVLLGDSLYHHPKKGLSIGKGHICYRDSLEPMQFRGDYFQNDTRSGKSYLTGSAICQYKLKKDTLYIHADTLYTEQDSTGKTRMMKALHQVRFFKQDLQGICDTLLYPLDSSYLLVRHKPIVWSSQVELKGESMIAYVKDSSIQQISVFNQATAISKVDTAGYYNQVGGRNMNAYFVRDTLVQVKVNGNAQTVYFPEETTSNDTLVEIQRKGMMRAYASDLKVYFKEGEVSGVTYLDKPDAVLYPMNQINKEEQFIQHFAWHPEWRPVSVEDLLKPARTPKP